jgi:hypothetical protein
MRVSFPVLVAIGAAAALLVLAVSNIIIPAETQRLTEVRPWLVARATGITAYLLLAAQVTAGLVMSHPTTCRPGSSPSGSFPGTSTWPCSPWRSSSCTSPYWPPTATPTSACWGRSFRAVRVPPPAVAVGTIALYSLLITAASARWTKLFPAASG